MNLKYLVLCVCFCGLALVQGYAQVSGVASDTINSLKITAVDYQSMLSDQFDFRAPLMPSLSAPAATYRNGPAINHLPGLFCKLEYQIEKKSKLAPRFRLGSLEYTEWREGKNNFYKPYN